MKAKRQGLTLIEVLIALSILAIVGGVVVVALISSMKLNSEGRVRERAINATSSWIDRFQAKALNFSAFANKRTYNYGYNYASDSTFSSIASDSSFDEWKQFKFDVDTDLYINNPLIWRVKIRTYYKRPGGKEGHFDTETLIKQ